MKKYLDLSKEQYGQFIQLPIDTSLQMLNLLKFKERVGDTDITGIQQYKAYMKSALPFFKKVNAKIIFYGNPEFNLIGPSQLEWDKVLIVEYATKDDFINMITAEGYPAQMRQLALEDSRLIFCTPTTF